MGINLDRLAQVILEKKLRESEKAVLLSVLPFIRDGQIVGVDRKRPACVKELAAISGLDRKIAGRALRSLSELGILQRHEDGNKRWFTVAPDFRAS
jgi:DNA-binding transcriptional ArsR family regulator